MSDHIDAVRVIAETLGYEYLNNPIVHAHLRELRRGRDAVPILCACIRDLVRALATTQIPGPPQTLGREGQLVTPEEYAKAMYAGARRECQGPVCSNEVPACFGILFETAPGEWKYEPHGGAREAHCVYECAAFAAEHNVIVRMTFGLFQHEFDCRQSASKKPINIDLRTAAKLIGEATNGMLPNGARDIVAAAVVRVATEADIAPGDPVRLMSGGPLMYVEEVQGGMARCRWTKPSGLVERGEFPVECLEPAEDGN